MARRNRPPESDRDSPTGRLAAVIRECYVHEYQVQRGAETYGCAEMPRWDGGRDQHGRRYQAVWPEMAEHFLRQPSVNMALFVYVQFLHARAGRPPRPKDLCSEQALRHYTQYVQELPLQVETEYLYGASAVQIRLRELAVVEMTEEQRMITVLMDEQCVSATPLFRYCAAEVAHLPTVATYYYSAARPAYARHAEFYDRQWGDFIPAVLRQSFVTRRVIHQERSSL